MANAMLGHHVDGVLNIVIRGSVNHSARHDFFYLRYGGIFAASSANAPQKITFGEDSHRTISFHDHDRTDVFFNHKVDSVSDRGFGIYRINL